ncbi:MAG: GAK system ATP-grasp enzyme [Gammaproteobacteria bacterium]|nr:GAK system ATP-grasp enzyme [Gammaproteobacteria bacterium]
MAEAKIGVIGLPGKWSTETLADAVQARTGERLVIDMGEVALDLGDNSLRYREHDLCRFDALIVKKISREYSPNSIDRLELLRVAEANGVRVFSPALSMLRLIDRLSCTATMASAGIPMPPTLITEDLQMAESAVMDYRSAVFKPLFSTKARGMIVVNADDPESDRRRQIGAFHADNPMMYIQKKMKLPGEDLGMVFLGGDYIGAYARVSQGESWNTTILHGGRYASAEPPDDWIEIAQRAQDLFNMDYTTVDMAETEDGPIVFEVSAFGGFRGAKEGLGINIAERYVDYVLEQIS